MGYTFRFGVGRLLVSFKFSLESDRVSLILPFIVVRFLIHSREERI